jgi:hypothetical protein
MSRREFDYSLDFKNTDFRRHPELYRIGKGEQGVLLVEPFKGEILPHWRFRTVAEAKESSAKIFEMFVAYLEADDFPGADMARKFLQMGWTRARRYANHKGGRKYDKETGAELPRTVDPEKAAAGLSHPSFRAVDSLCVSSPGSVWRSAQKSHVGRSSPNA